MYELSALGLSPFFTDQLRDRSISEKHLARIAAEHRGIFEVWSTAGKSRAELSGALRHQLENDSLPGVGDWVALREPPAPDCTALIEGVLARRTIFTRGAAGRETRVQVVAANVDLVFAICGLDRDFNIRRIERYVARIWASGAQPAVVLNKTDLCPNSSTRVREVESHCPGVRVYTTSALQNEGTTPIAEAIGNGVTAAFIGSSGAGKSTLVNALVGEHLMATGEVRASDGRGCHITSHRQLVLLPRGGLVLDTPGMRELQVVDEEGLDSVFDDIAAISHRCRFRDCRHEWEPGCAVREAVLAGEIGAERLEHYHKLIKEAHAYEKRHDEHLRRRSERVWGQLHEEASRIRRWKSGE
jgi:ribosome biogenesis GTPase / thiamine phosphate phosphatase